ncbi:Alpha/beta hydrolase family protein [Gimesia panareensis]|uniref:Alpha/beta hydrolase family protein n=1 Tax=Gimesia panareensis TaxID=2527978 RepID=A0A518FI39_9PLAN|nr:dienelactone hydrolase family protein [Gimesia panareensis]QDV16006.1 Alpha/beta hydrolase family protein [Gimesia panareensis]
MKQLNLSCILVLSLLGSLSLQFGKNQLAAEEAPPWAVLKPVADQSPLPGTQPLTDQGDLSAKMIEGIDRFLLKQIAIAAENRSHAWQRDLSSSAAYEKSVMPQKQELMRMLGISDPVISGRFSYVGSAPQSVENQFTIYEVTWPVLNDLTGAGLLLVPAGKILGDVVAVPEADQAPETLVSSDQTGGNYAQQLARSGFRVLIPTLINRDLNKWNLSQREWLHRPAFELGRTLAGYEVQKIMAGVQQLKQTSADSSRPTGVIGWGEGGRLALYAAALDPDIDATAVCGYFGPREQLWQEPADRNVFGQLNLLGDAEIASLVAPRTLIIENGTYPRYGYRTTADGKLEVISDHYPKLKGKPGKLLVPGKDDVRQEFARAQEFVSGLKPDAPSLALIETDDAVASQTLQVFIASLDAAAKLATTVKPLEIKSAAQADARHDAQLAEIERHNQRLLQLAYETRIEFMKNLKTGSLTEFEKSVEPYRELFKKDVVGEFALKLLPANARTRKYQEGPKTISYQVEMDVFPDVTAYGILTLPKDLKLDGSEKRPVVVTQHGLEGRPRHTVGEEKYRAYKSFSTHLAERGFITFAPQNPYILFDRFRTLQFKAQSIGRTLFSIAVPQHQQLTDWLKTLPFVDGKRIGFYGISYGGKSAMRIPPLVDNYALSICSADFGEWVWKNAATDQRSLRYSYANKGEYEIFEWNLGGTFNYAEMAALICPRPFMVERGHFDGVEPDDRVAQEYAKVRFLYQAQLGIGDRTTIEWIKGPHAIHEQGAYEFLHQHLNWPVPAE